MMTNASVSKFSASRRKGDVYELHLLALQCLRMLVEPKIVHVLHEYRPVVPADDVVVESIDRVDCYQAKHAHDPHALLTFQDLVATTDLQLNIRRLKVAWDQLRLYGKEVYLHIYTNRAADEELAKLLADDRILPAVIEDSIQKQRRASLKAVAEIAGENEFKQFLRSLRFDLRQHSLDQLREHIQQHWIQHRLGLDPKEAYQRLMFNVEKWGLESQSRPILRQEVLQALQIDSGTLPQVFHVDPRTYVAHPAFKRRLDEILASAQTGYIAIVGPPGSGKSTFLTRYIHHLEQQQHQSVIRYYCFTQVHDPLFLRRVTGTEFLKSMIEQLQQQFGHLPPEGGRYDYSPERLQQLLSFLGQHFTAQDRKLVMVVDGLDHAYRADLEATKKLLTVLPEHLPHGVVCLIGAQGTQYLPAPIQRECREQRYLRLPLFDPNQTFRYLRHYPQLRNRLTLHQAQRIHEQSEGLPLYLHYIAEELSLTPVQDFEAIISRLPPHENHIDHYHGWLWDELSDAVPLRHLCGLAARLRFRVPTSDLVQMVGLDAFGGEQSLKRIRHLLDIKETGARIFHNSFREFIQAELLPEELRQLDREILGYLEHRRGTPAWFAHVCAYAMAAQNYAFLTGTLTASYVEEAIAKGRSRSEIIEALHFGAEAAVKLDDPIATARIATLMSHTVNRLDYHIDRRQLQRTLFALDEPDAALAAIAHEGQLYSVSADTAEALIDLAVQGHEAVGRELAYGFFDRLPPKLDTVDLIHSVGELAAVYGAVPIEFLAHNILALRSHTGFGGPDVDSSGVLLLRTVLRRFYQFGRYPLVRILRRILLAQSEDQFWAEEWLFQIALLEAEYRPNAAAYHLQRADGQIQEQRKRIRLAGAAVGAQCDADLVKTLLGDAVLLPSLQNDAVRYFGAQDDFRVFRAYVTTLTYCARDNELEALRAYLNTASTWLTIYYLANLDMVVARVRLARGQISNPAPLLLSFDNLIKHRKREDERIIEVFDAVRQDLPEFLQESIDGYMAAHGDVALLLERLRCWGESELISYHYGIGLAVADYRNEMAALKAAAKYPILQVALQPLLLALHEKIRHRTLETQTRTNHLLQLAETAAVCGYKAMAHQWLLEGLRASNGYGYRKDITLSILTDAVKVVNKIEPQKALERFADIADWNSWLPRVTDGKETQWFCHHLFDAVLDYDFCIGLRLLLTYRYHVAPWKFSDCLVKLLTRYHGNNPQLAYVLSELINECQHKDGFEDKFRARHHLMKRAADDGKVALAAWIASRLRQFLQCEVSPDRRLNLIRDYNQTASHYKLPTLTESSADMPLAEETEGEETAPQEIQLGGASVTPAELMERMSESVAMFAQTIAELEATNQFYNLRTQVDEAACHLIQKAASVVELAQIEDVVTRDSLSAHDRYVGLAEAYRRLGAFDRTLAKYRQAFESFHNWGLWDKRTEYLAPLIAHDPAKTLRFLLQCIQEHVKRYDGGFGTSTLFVRALDALGSEYRGAILHIYQEFHDFVGQHFTDLPTAEVSPYDWLRHIPPAIVSFEDAALELIFDEWKEPTLHRRIALTHLIHDLTLAQPSLLIPRLLAALEHDDRTLRVQAALVLNAVTLQQPDLLQPHIEAISLALDTPHLEVTHYLEDTLSRIGAAVTLPAQIEGRLAALHLGIQSRRVVIPSRSIGPSAHFRQRVLPRVMRSVREMVQDVCEGLDLDVDAMYWRIERHMHTMGYDKETAAEEDRGRWHHYLHPQGSPFIPFETYISSLVRHAFAEVVEHMVREQAFPDHVLEALYRRTRFYDPSLPWRHLCPKPQDIALPRFTDPHGGAEITSEVRAWLHFEDVPPVAVSNLSEAWTPLLDFYSQSRGRLHETCIAMSHLVSRTLSDAILAGRSTPDENEAVLQLAPKPPYFTMTIEEAQYLLETSHFSLNPAVAPRVPLIAVHWGTWWYLEQYDIVGLAGPWMRHYALGWKSTDGLDMQMGGRDVLRYIHWRDGYIADDYQYELVGRGTRLSIAHDLLHTILSEFDLRLLVIQRMSRQIEKPRYGTKGIDEKQERKIIQIVKIV